MELGGAHIISDALLILYFMIAGTIGAVDIASWSSVSCMLRMRPQCCCALKFGCYVTLSARCADAHMRPRIESYNNGLCCRLSERFKVYGANSYGRQIYDRR
jgi:hypothetical protein